VSETQFQPVSLANVGLVPRKFTSICASKKVWKRLFALKALIPDCPPSPKMVTNQLPLPFPL
jgi:hypothetical protein